jgi:hypothetical protein
MPQPVYISGHAGTGKTTKLLELTAIYARQLLVGPHQRVLAMAYMHGARRRLESSLDGDAKCAKIPRLVTTIDSFALSLVNRWRASLGFALPVAPTKVAVNAPFERHYRLWMPFSQIASLASELLRRPTVARLAGASYPLVVIDEFQDCAGPKLDVICALADVSHLLVAADSFQLLQSDVVGCPAVEWIDGLGDGGLRERHELTDPHRTDDQGILNAARALRENTPVAGASVPVCYGPAVPTAFRIMERLALGWDGPRWTGTTAIICPASGGIVDSVLKELAGHLKKRGRSPISWVQQTTSEEEQRRLYGALGIARTDDQAQWQATANPETSLATEVAERARRFARLRGLDRITNDLIAAVADQTIHASRAYCRTSGKYIITTVHGAKNREFDNVFVLWPYRLPGNAELHRRLLYNALTRAKINCMILDTRKKAVVEGDPVMQLLGSPQPAVPPKPKKKTKKQDAGRCS